MSELLWLEEVGRTLLLFLLSFFCLTLHLDIVVGGVQSGIKSQLSGRSAEKGYTREMECTGETCAREYYLDIQDIIQDEWEYKEL